jgi:myosin-7
MNDTGLCNGLITRSIVTRGESVSTTMSTEAAMDVRDAFVKAIYGHMFIWLIDKINIAIFKTNRDPRHFRKSIGVLDIFGFENFDKNRRVYFVSMLFCQAVGSV